jgi:hypothetical protein
MRGMTFVESRQIFDLFLKDFPDFDHFIGDTAAIIEEQVFEKAVMQIAHALPLSEEQQNAAQVILRPEDPVDENAIPVGDNDDKEVTTESYSQELQQKLKRQKRETSKNEKANMYMNLDMLPGTSVNCERLFSAAKFILSDTRKRTTPNLFEALLLLKVNQGFWNVDSASQAIGQTTSDVDKNTSNEVESDDESISGAFH